MSLSQWFLLIAVVVGVGCLQVAQRNAVVLKGYAVGERMTQLHTQQTHVSWLDLRVAELTSPKRLSHAMQDQQLKLVAWSLLVPTSSVPNGASASIQPSKVTRQDGRAEQPIVHIAAAKSGQDTIDDDTSD